MTLTPHDEQKALKTILSLDFSMQKSKMMNAQEGVGWSQQKTDEIEKWYRRFLFLIFKYPDCSIVPTKDIDTFWHYHILDTRKYAADCDLVFGEFLHHFPYFGLRGEEDAKNLRNSFDETQKLFSQEFGILYLDSDSPSYSH